MAPSERRDCASLIVLHGQGRSVDVVRHLDHGYRSTRRKVGIFAAHTVAQGMELEGFMNSVGADDSVDVVHLVLPDQDIGPNPAEALTLELSESIVEQLTASERTLRHRFPALHGVDSWVIVDLGRFWSASARRVTQAILDVGAENRIRGVFAVAGSTVGSVAGTPDDRAGMVADTTWILATSDFGDSSGLAGERATAWLIGTRSFTVNGHVWNLNAAAAGVRHALLDGPLRPATESMLDESNEAARRWLKGRGIGTEGERKAMVSSAAGDALDRLTIDRNEVLKMAPKHWGPAAELQFRLISSDPLRRFTKLMQANTQALLNGRPGETDSGHRPSYDDALVTELGRPSGAARTERFTTATNEGLEALRREVGSTSTAVSQRNLDHARDALDAATQSLGEVKPWLARMLLAVTLVAVLVKDAPEVWMVAGAPALTALLLGLWLTGSRQRAARLREEYVAAAEALVRAKALERVFAEQVEMIKLLQEHVGAFLDEQGDPVPMGQGEPPPETTRARDVLRLNEALQAALTAFDDPATLFADVFSLEPCGQFFDTYPDSARGLRLADRLSPAASAHGHAVQSDADAVLSKIWLDWDAERIKAELLAVCRVERETAAGVQGIEDFGPELATIALPRLVRSNAPRLESDLNAPERAIAVLPDGRAPDGFGPVIGVVDVVANSTDPRRITLAWLLSQSTARVDPALVLPQMEPPPESPGPESGPWHLAEGGGV